MAVYRSVHSLKLIYTNETDQVIHRYPGVQLLVKITVYRFDFWDTDIGVQFVRINDQLIAVSCVREGQIDEYQGVAISKVASDKKRVLFFIILKYTNTSEETLSYPLFSMS